MYTTGQLIGVGFLLLMFGFITGFVAAALCIGASRETPGSQPDQVT